MKKLNYAWLVLASCCALSFTMGTTLNSSGQYFAAITKELGVGVGQLSLFVTVQNLSMSIMAPFVGKILPKRNVRALLSFCIALMLITTGLMSTFTALWQWYVSGVILGVTGAFCFMIPVSIIVNNWFEAKTGFAVGLAMAFSGVGGAVMNPTVAYFIENYSWRTAYIVNAVLTAVLVLPFTLFIINYKPEDRGLKPYGHRETAAHSVINKHDGVKSVEASKALRSLPFICLFASIGIMSYTTCYPQQFSPYVNYLGLSAAVSGYMASLSMVGNTLGKFGLGAISDKIGIKPAVFLGTALCLISFGLLLFGGKSVPALMTAALFCGFTMSMTTVGVSLSARHIFGPKDYGTIFSYLSVSQNASYAVGMPIIGFMFDITGSFFLSFAVATVLCILVFFLLYAAFRANVERTTI